MNFRLPAVLGAYISPAAKPLQEISDTHQIFPYCSRFAFSCYQVPLMTMKQDKS